MYMGYYTLTVEMRIGERVEHQTFIIEAENRQMVKYHFHYTLKDHGFTDTQFGKHCLENWDAGILKEIYEIREIDGHEYEIMNDHMFSFNKTAPSA